ncbi:thermonuclease family protein [Pseudosulfitobacter sp. SM2401]|uniref:thermonuclease family protein n=1 Tax=Pseudosulfitobacter sp. SM2401 TaxID=3350098 RepID=UPI0036F3D5C0
MFRFCIAFVLFLFPEIAAAEFSGRVLVIDGDTIDVGAVRVRIHGIDAPEKDQHCQSEQGVDWACGLWVNEQVRQRIQGQIAHCVQTDIDRYNRVVATCTVAGQDIGRAFVADGLAFAYRKYSMAYDLDEKGAMISNRGLHASHVQNPSQFRNTQTNGRIPRDRDCVIKGNISVDGTRIFHVPGQAFYDRTGISTRNGERWFCSSSDAIKAGWRASRR